VSSEPGLAIPSRVASASRQVSRLDEAESIAFFGLTGFERVLKTTVSLCPECLAHVPAIVFTRGGRVLVAKSCAAHGRSEAVLENDERFYFLSNKDRSGRRFAEPPAEPGDRRVPPPGVAVHRVCPETDNCRRVPR